MIRIENRFLESGEVIFLAISSLIHFRKSLFRISQESFFMILLRLAQLS
jgi:hypothetical protein